MRNTIFLMATSVFFAITLMSPVQAGVAGEYEVVGVEAEDMLKMRSGPGIGYTIILGLPNGTLVRVHSCEQSGSTRWCKVSLKQARALKGYVSASYLRKL